MITVGAGGGGAAEGAGAAGGTGSSACAAFASRASASTAASAGPSDKRAGTKPRYASRRAGATGGEGAHVRNRPGPTRILPPIRTPGRKTYLKEDRGPLDVSCEGRLNGRHAAWRSTSTS